MQVELTVQRAGRRRTMEPGDVVELPDDEARRLIQAGQAVPVRSVPVETTNTRAPVRRRTRRA